MSYRKQNEKILEFERNCDGECHSTYTQRDLLYEEESSSYRIIMIKRWIYKKKICSDKGIKED